MHRRPRVPSGRRPGLSILDMVVPRAEASLQPRPCECRAEEAATGPKAMLSPAPRTVLLCIPGGGGVNSAPDSCTWLMFLSPWASALSFN